MITATQNLIDAIYSPVRTIRGKVEMYEGSTLSSTFSYDDYLKEITIERVGEENKFFGIGICQKINIKLVDAARVLNISTANSFKIFFGNGAEYINSYPLFQVSEVHRDENTNELSITAYDLIYEAGKHNVAEITITSYTIEEFAIAAAQVIGISNVVFLIPEGDTAFTTSYPEGANFDGTETIKEALDDVAEATQTIYYINSNNELVFKRLDKDGTPVLEIDKSKYITLKSSTSRRLGTIYHVTELGDDVFASTVESGSTQYVRDNAFWDLRDDIGELVDAALARVGGITINQFTLDNWRGNFLLEIGDKIALTTKDDKTVNSFIFNDTVKYDGALSESTLWDYTSTEEETAENPSSLGDALKQTFARVDKANKTVELMASEVQENTEKIAGLLINTENITASVQEIQNDVTESLEGFNEDIETLSKEVSAAITSEELTIEIKKELANGVDKVETNTGFTFNDEGLTIDKTGSEMSTQITEDGMTVYKQNEAVLVANNVGVEATNLHATTYLIIGTNSRFEDFGDRTGCFWIGQ